MRTHDPSLRRTLRFTAGFMLVASGCSAPFHEDSHAAAEQSVIYGVDDRKDVYAHPSPELRRLAERSTVALIDGALLDLSEPRDVKIWSRTLGELVGLCEGERFREDPTPAFCSGALVGEDLVLTAGHCVSSKSECSQTRFVFRFYRSAAGRLETLTEEDVFRCREIVAREDTGTLDYALLRLDRPATPRFQPAPIRSSSAALEAGDAISVIGSGSGVPFKIDAGGTVRDGRALELDFFVAETDTFGASSGSAVYDNRDFSLAGVLARGAQDYTHDGRCAVANVCLPGACRGEEVTYVQHALEALCASKARGQYAELCEPSAGEVGAGNE